MPISFKLYLQNLTYIWIYTVIYNQKYCNDNASKFTQEWLIGHSWVNFDELNSKKDFFK